jgi:hypothetical protein
VTGVLEPETSRLLNYAFFNQETASKKVLRRSARGALTESPLSQIWLGWSERRQASGMAFLPGSPPGILDDGRWNYGVQRAKPKKGNVKPFLDLVEFLFVNEGEKAQRWFLGWCAHPFKRPNEKLFTAAFVWSTQQGAGKGQLARCLGLAHGRKNVAEINFNKLQSDFVTAELERKTLVHVDEADGSYETREYSGRVKSLITDDFMRVNQKYVPATQIESRAAWLLTTNHVDSLRIERDARRFFVVEGPNVDPQEKWKNAMSASLVREVNAWALHPESGPALLDYLLHIRTPFVNGAMALQTKGFEKLTETLSTAVDEFAHDCCSSGAWEGVLIPPLVTVDDLVKLYNRKRGAGPPISRPALGKALSNAGAKHLLGPGGRLRKVLLPDGRQVKPVSLREHEHWLMQTTHSVISYLTTNAVGISAPSTNLDTEIVRLRSQLRSREAERAKSAEKQGKKEA